MLSCLCEGWLGFAFAVLSVALAVLIPAFECCLSGAAVGWRIFFILGLDFLIVSLYDCDAYHGKSRFVIRCSLPAKYGNRLASTDIVRFCLALPYISYADCSDYTLFPSFCKATERCRHIALFPAGRSICLIAAHPANTFSELTLRLFGVVPPQNGGLPPLFSLFGTKPHFSNARQQG